MHAFAYVGPPTASTEVGPRAVSATVIDFRLPFAATDSVPPMVVRLAKEMDRRNVLDWMYMSPVMQDSAPRKFKSVTPLALCWTRTEPSTCSRFPKTLFRLTALCDRSDLQARARARAHVEGRAKARSYHRARRARAGSTPKPADMHTH